VLVADHPDDASLPEDRGVEHGTNAKGDKIGIAKLVGRRVHGGVLGGNLAALFESAEVGGKIAGLKDSARGVPVLRELEELTATKQGAVFGKGPHSHSFDLDRAGRHLCHAP